MNKINLIQFLPYFPPHKGGLETVAEELSFFYVKNEYGEVFNIIFDVGQPSPLAPLPKVEVDNREYIKNKSGNIIGYKQKGYTVYLLPSFDLVFNFPFPKFWKKEFWEILKITGTFTKNNKTIVQTHTRFFLSSFLGGLFAKFYKLKWVHIEHGSEYVLLGSKFKTKCAYFYDKIIGKWIFSYSDEIVAISNGVKKFIQNEFVKNREIEVIYNGINFIPGEKINNGDIIKIGYVGRLVKLKGVELLINSFKNLQKKYPNIILEIVGDGDEKKYLESIFGENINFLGFQNREYIASNFLPTVDILVNPSFQEGLPTVVLEGLLSKCIVVATDVGGTKEISDKNDLIIVNKGDIESLEKGLEKAILSYKNLVGLSFNNVLNEFDWNKNIKKYFSLYNEL